MLKRTLFLLLAIFVTVSMVSAKTYTVKLHQPSVVEGKELKPGNYKLEVTDSKVMITNGRETVETQVKTEEADARFSSTSVRYTDAEGKMKIREIRLGGTSTKLVFN